MRISDWSSDVCSSDLTIFFSGFSLQRPADCALLLGMLADADGNPIYPLIYVLQPPDVMSERRDAFFERLIGTYGQRLAPGIPLPTLAQLERDRKSVV